MSADPAIGRRTFMQTTGLGALALLGGCQQDVRRTILQPAPPTAWGKRTTLLDSERFAGGLVQNFTCPAYPLGNDRWRLWISVSGAVPFNFGIAQGRVGESFEVTMAQLSTAEPADAPLSLGNLPDGWRPVQPVHLRLPNGKHRLYFWAHARGIVRYLAAESDDGRRFRVLDPLRPCLYHPADRAVGPEALREAGLSRMAVRKKAAPVDGEPLAPAGLVSNDATNVYPLADGGFEMYSVALVEVPTDDPRYMAHDNTPGWLRVIDRYTSGDGIHWENRRRVITPDAADPLDQQFYYLSVTHTDRGRVGILGHYRVAAQTMDIEWCYSDDGVRWQRPLRRPWLPRSAPGTLPDSYGVYAPHALVHDRGEWHLLYTGVNDAHNHKHAHGPRQRAVMHTACPSIWT